MPITTMADIWALEHECTNLFGTCRACSIIWNSWEEDEVMATIEEARTHLNEAIHQYANAAVLVDRDGGAWDADVEPFEKVKDAITAAMMAVLEEAFDHRYVEITKGSDEHRLAIHARIAALAAPQAAQDGQEPVGEEG